MTNYKELKVIKDSWGTKISLVKDLNQGSYLVEKKLTVDIQLQKVLFVNEMTIHSDLQHRYILKFHEQFCNTVFLMEYAARGDLNNFIGRGISRDEKIKLCRNFLMGLEYLHKKNYLHNDVKPSNILVTDNMRAKLGDFAFASPPGKRIFEKEPDYFINGTKFFTPDVELINSSSPWFPDIYSSGLVMYLLFTDQFPPCKLQLNEVPDQDIRIIIQSAINGKYEDITQLVEKVESL